jgi:hypothetical protein
MLTRSKISTTREKNLSKSKLDVSSVLLSRFCFVPDFPRKQNVSQRLKELAQRVDFSEAIDDEGSEPAAKKSAQRWPWEFTHSKLK